MLSRLPVLGIKLRRYGAMRILKRWGYISLPNRIAEHKVMNEMYGDVTPEDIAEEIHEELSSSERLKRTREEFLSLSGESGAASRLCDIAAAE